MAQQTTNTPKHIGLWSVKNQFIGLLIVASIAPIIIVSILTINQLREAEIQTIRNNYQAIVNTQAISVADLMQSNLSLMRLAADSEVIEASIIDANEAPPDTDNIAAIDVQWREAVANGTMTPAMEAALNNPATRELRELSAIQPAMTELFITDRAGRLVASNGLIPSDYDQADEQWWQRTLERGINGGYIAPQPEFDDSTGRFSLQMAVPIEKDETFIGVLRATLDVTALQANLAKLDLGTTGEVFIVNENGETIMSDSDVSTDFVFPSDLIPRATNNEQLTIIQDVDGHPYIAQATEVRPGFNEETTTSSANHTLIDNLGWNFLVVQTESEAFENLDAAINNAVIAVLAVVGILTVLGYIAASHFIRPLSQLAAVADAIASGGNWAPYPMIDRNDEFGLLNDAFHHMASTLSANVANLEKRVYERTKDLETSADIASAANQVREIKDLTHLTVNLIRDRFNYYYVQVYLIDPMQKVAILHDGTGPIGRRLIAENHYLPLNGNSLVAQAVRTGEITVVQNTLTEATITANKLLPETRSEMTIPLRRKNAIIGVLDIQHNEINSFTQDQQQLFQSLADQLAVTFENVQLLQQTHKRALQLATVAQVSIEAASNLDLNELLKSVATLTRDSFSLYHTHIYLLHKSMNLLLLAAGSGEAGTIMVEQGYNIPLDQEDSLIARAARTRQPVLVNDVSKESGFLPNNFMPLTRSELAVPLITGDDVIGVLDVQSDKKDFFTEDDVQAQATLASQIAIAIQNARAYQALESTRTGLQQSEKRLELALTGTSDGLWDWNVYTNDLYFSPGWKNMLGYTDDAFPNTFDAWEAAIHPEDVEKFTQTVHNYLEGATGVFEVEYRLRHKAGHYRHILARGGAEANDKGIIIRLAGTHTDITERVQAQMALKASEEEAQATRADAQILYQISALLSEALDETQVLNAIVDMGIITDLSFITLSIFDQHDYESSSFIEVVAEWNQADHVLIGQAVPIEESPFVSLLDRSEIIYFADAQDNNTLNAAIQAFIQQLDVKTFAIVPLTIGHRWLGFLTIYHRTPYDYSKRLIDLLYSLSRQLAIALERVYLQRQTNLHVSRLRAVADVSTNTISIRRVSDLLDSVVNLTKEHFHRYHAQIYLLDKSDNDLILAAGAGDAGQQMVREGYHIALHANRSLIARAARTMQPVVAQDVDLEPDFLPNKYLPNTRSEMAMPISYDNELIGVLDIQDEQPNQFNNIDMQVKRTLANQIAIALRNAEAFERERQTVEQLLEVDRLKQEFLANMSHELRTPLNSIIGYSEVLLDGLDGDLNEDVREDVEAIFLSGKHLLNLINEILDLAKIEAGQMQLHRKALDFDDTINKMVTQNQILVKNKPIQLHVVEETSIPTVYADPTRLNQVLLNLLSNAIKFTEEGSITIRYGMKDDQTLYVRIEDTGIGMNEADLERVFERFHQADGSSTRRAGGTGLGLTITRQLIQLHGGDISCESELGVGSTFWFTLPITSSENANMDPEITIN